MSEQKCSKCKKYFPTTSDYFHKDKSAKTGFNAKCKRCAIEYVLGMQKNGVYNSFRAARERCTNKNHKDYLTYGGRGIQFLIPSWQALKEAIGDRPKGYTLERLDTNGNYAIGNVKWASRKEQARNTRRNAVTHEEVVQIRHLSALGLSNKELVIRFGVCKNTVGNILSGRSWNDE